MALLKIIDFAHSLLRQHIREGDTVVDATAGNGYDTLLLAQCVGDDGKVFAFDVQEIALMATVERLQQHGVLSRVTLLHQSHEYMEQFVPIGVSAIVFNFGYLPRGDKTLTTQAYSSLKALQSALKLLAIGGIAVAVLYTGHDAGKIEAQAIQRFVVDLPNQFTAISYGFLNRPNHPPLVLAIEKHC